MFLSVMMVSEVKYPSFKKLDFRSRRPFAKFAGAVAVVACFVFLWKYLVPIVLPLIFTSYLVYGFARTNWDAPQTVTVKGVSNDNDTEQDSSDQNYSLAIGPAVTEDLDYSGMEKSISMVNVDATNGTFEISDTTSYLITSETSGIHHRDNLTIKLLVAPTSDVVLPLSSSDTTEGLVEGSSENQRLLTFTSSNWKDEQTIILEGVDDDVDENLVEGE